MKRPSQKKTKRKRADAAPSPRAKKAKHGKVATSPQTSINTPEQVKESKANGRHRKSNIEAVGVQVPNTFKETEEVANTLQTSPEPENIQSSPAKDQHSPESPSSTSEDLDTTKKLPEKPTATEKDRVEAQTSTDIDSGTDSPTLDLSKPPCSKPQEGEDDEGIHSHDGGSDISDCASEVSYDSGLNGKLPETPTEELPSPTQLLSHTCVFCDRTFPLEMDYRRHLNRHLVNVYYLDAATQGNK